MEVGIVTVGIVLSKSLGFLIIRANSNDMNQTRKKLLLECIHFQYKRQERKNFLFMYGVSK